MSNKVLGEYLAFPESSKRREDRLWFGDMFGNRVNTIDFEGHTRVVAEVEDRPSGLGFLPDGT
jgi:hypothetical protein